MKTNSKMRNPVAKRREGLVAIIPVAILIVVSLVAIGIWSLSSTTTRSGSAELAQLESEGERSPGAHDRARRIAGAART
jgi:hypothetical protein